MPGNLLQRLHRDDRGGTTSAEYVMILALVVLPIGTLYPMYMGMVRTYGYWFVNIMRLPFP